jgi:hypothetical protein
MECLGTPFGGSFVSAAISAVVVTMFVAISPALANHTLGGCR